MKVLTSENDKIIVNEYPADPFIKRRVYQTGKYVSALAGFDIETSNVELNGETLAIMYLWQYGFDYGGGIDLYVGRTWSDFQKLLGDIERAYNLGSTRRLVTCIHNAGFEFQFIRSVGDISEMFAVKERVPVRFMFRGCHEMRCTYKLSNMSLYKFCEQENAKHGKVSGFDYTITRYPDTPISDFELLYGVSDILGMLESVKHLMASENDTLRTLPFTSTGYLRRDARERVQSNPNNRRDFIEAQLTPEQYKLCKAATRGGNVHANYLFAGSILNDIHGMDKASSYPWQMVSKRYPHGKYVKETSGKILPDASNVMLVKYTNLHIKEDVFNPYIAYGKCERFATSPPREIKFDNGRILSAPQIVLAITEIDAAIIERQYHFDTFEIITHFVSGMKPMCEEFRQMLFEMFKAKCELKTKDPYFYAKYKNKINAAFGMLLTDITREDITYIDGKWDSDLPPVITSLTKYYKNYRSFLTYQHGIYVTAWARKELQDGIDAVGIDFVYSDTDSVKARGEHKEAFDRINADLIAQANNMKVPAVEIGGETYRLGVWEFDSHYSEFCTHGAKKYAYVYSNDPVNGKHKGELGVTVAGLSKIRGAEYLKKNGGLEAFRVGQMWDIENSGRLKAIYDDRIRLEKIMIDGHLCEVTSNVALVPTTYTLNYTKDYAALLELRDIEDEF